MADFTFLDFIPEYAHVEHAEAGWSMFGPRVLTPEGHITLNHVVFGGIAMLVILIGALVARKKYANAETALIPDDGISVRNLFETLMDAVYGLMESMMGKENTERYFMLVSGLAFFILVNNLMGLIPGLYPATSSFNTNLACSVTVFVVYNVAGLREHGFVNYVKHFMGPSILLAPLIFPIELVSHLVRPVSLAIRPTGNVGGDHMVLSIFSDLASDLFTAIGGLVGLEHFSFPFLLPVPFYFLGLLVSIIQATVFCLLSTIYITMASAHDH